MRFFILFSLFLIFAAQNSYSDMRSFVWTYEYLIMDKGKAEIEHYMTILVPKKTDFKGKASIEHKLEVEVGMTNHFDFSVYQNFIQKPDETFQYTGFDFRARFKIGEKDQFILDPLIYLEYGSNFNLSSHKLEGKLILAKNIGDFIFAINPIFEIEYEDETELSFSYAMGLCYEFSSLFRTGIEFKGDKNAHYVGITFSHGKENLWVAASPTIIISDNPKSKPEFMFRMILGLGL